MYFYMICHFYIRYKTNYGQSLVIRVELGEGSSQRNMN